MNPANYFKMDSNVRIWQRPTLQRGNVSNAQVLALVVVKEKNKLTADFFFNGNFALTIFWFLSYPYIMLWMTNLPLLSMHLNYLFTCSFSLILWWPCVSRHSGSSWNFIACIYKWILSCFMDREVWIVSSKWVNGFYK